MANHGWCQFPRLAAGLAAAGVSSFRFDHAMAIQSKSQRRDSFLMGNHDDEVADMVDAVVLVQEAMGRRVACLLGHSKGGINALLFAARHADLGVPRVVSLAGRFRVREGVLRRFGDDIMARLAAEGPLPRREAGGMEWTMTEADFRGRADLDMEAAARAVPPTTRLLLLHGTADVTIPWEESRECAALVAGAELALVDGADHNFTRAAHAAEMVARVVEFVVRGEEAGGREP